MDWYNYIRDVCAQHFIDNPVQIGGPGVEVEIDESSITGGGMWKAIGSFGERSE